MAENYLTRIYINNEPYLLDSQSQKVCPETERGEWMPVHKFRQQEKFFVASYPVISLNGVPYFHEEERKLFRRLGAPFDFKTYYECEDTTIGTVKPKQLLALMKAQRALALGHTRPLEKAPWLSRKAQKVHEPADDEAGNRLRQRKR